MNTIKNPKTIEARACNRPWWDGIDFIVRTPVSSAQPIVFVEDHDKSGYQLPVEPTFALRMQEAQVLMDDLWACGLRPSEGTGSAGAMAAVQEHLADLRKLVFK